MKQVCNVNIKIYHWVEVWFKESEPDSVWEHERVYSIEDSARLAKLKVNQGCTVHVNGNFGHINALWSTDKLRNIGIWYQDACKYIEETIKGEE